MKAKANDKKLPNQQAGNKAENDPEGYPAYPPGEDIYSKYQEEKDINPEDISRKIKSNESIGTSNEKGFDDDVSGSDLDIPGSDMDDEQENIGIEDEENNYYSLGGDDHNDLDEDISE